MNKELSQPLFDVLVAPRWSDQDSMGHINHVQYFRYLEEARVQWMANTGFAMGEDGELSGVIVAAIGLNFRKEWHYHKRLRAKAWVIHIGNSSFRLLQSLYSEDGCELVAEGETTLVCVDAEHRPTPIADGERAELHKCVLA
ncbi:acyl-CoA thioesterase [Zhongshania aquimaris]|uniref:Acyl-CoA thioesterase n=1 Tax=Zhongshania aquimaris TaxID=2857107 RepID=A0ABS6VR38_9GAMM|nr:thioesterase family protein [Zhongshania aquimaris]MBW2940788.1 acyl-CoA thioesterase [Zhongshania aquimaris]